MAKIACNKIRQSAESGFVLVTALIMLSLLTLMSLGMYFTSSTATKTSGSAQSSTEAYYYAETAINYMTWALANDAEFDNFTYSGTYIASPFGEPNYPTTPNPSTIGDREELGSYMWDPGPTVISDSGAGILGQIMYFDNSPMGSRSVCFEDATIFSNCIDVSVDPATRAAPTMYNISVNLPRYIKLDIAASGAITPTIPQLPHQNPPVVGQDVPQNGAVVWITAGDSNNVDRDIELFPLDPANASGGTAATACAAGQMPSCPCDFSTIGTVTNPVACEAHATGDATAAAGRGAWVDGPFPIVIYAIGYVNGKATHLLRAVVTLYN
ncbi:hypothetical protein MMIC_P2234 [Mariprofundus micogutta]|uniref:Type 4 fimbrial biogenesis protein PilX N-terminal domain-containing protein n=1 Tax=Mariprofundus micogutta TaxID=1921010 RepID=A0A1L8CQP9_9PROT|nr:PilX N-terminal domain-containing pilus assembly protein [Mariprofundus micogutta]GAV21252.1 hypothetical protein MMIC_P2234 [Mariprofundus micogutta]